MRILIVEDEKRLAETLADIVPKAKILPTFAMMEKAAFTMRFPVFMMQSSSM